MKYRDLIKRVEGDGWVLVARRVVTCSFAMPKSGGTVTISAGGKMGKDVPPGTLNSVLN